MGAVLRQMSRSKGAGLMLAIPAAAVPPCSALNQLELNSARHCLSNSRGGALCASSANSAIARKRQGRVP